MGGIKALPKVWGRELWIANLPEFCGKILEVNKGACSSYHYHTFKKEVFYCFDGEILLNLEGIEIKMTPDSAPVLIEPGAKHSFLGIQKSRIFEVSNYHDDADVHRLSESFAGI